MRQRAAYGWLVLTMALWGSAFPSSRWAVGQVPHTVAALFRFGGGALVLVVIVFLTRRRGRTPSRRDVLWACLTGAIGVFGYNALFFWGITMAPASDGAVIFPALVPVITTAVLVLAGAESAGPTRIVGLALGALGAAGFFVATSTGVTTADPHRLLGDAVFAAGAAIWTAYTLLNKKIQTGTDPLQAVTLGMIAGSVLLAGMALPDLGAVPWADLTTGFWVNAVYLAIGPTAVAYLLYVRGIRTVGAAATSAMMFAVPVFGTAISFLVLGESFTLVQGLAAVVMLGGAYLAVVGRWRRAMKPAASPTPVESPANSA